MNIRVLIYSLIFSSVSMFAQTTVSVSGCWPLESSPISLGEGTSLPKMVSPNENFLYLYGNTLTSLAVQSAGSTNVWELGPASVDDAVSYSIVKKKDAKGQTIPIVFSSILNATSGGGYFITDANLRNANISKPSLSTSLTNPKMEAYGVPDTSGSIFILGRTFNRVSTVLSFSEIRLVSGIANNLKNVEFEYNAPYFDIYAEVVNGNLLVANENHVFVFSSDGKTLQLDNINYGGRLLDSKLRATITYGSPGDFKVIGSDADRIYLAIKNTKTAAVEILSILKRTIVANAVITPDIIASFPSTSDVIEVSEIVNGTSFFLAINNKTRIEVREIALTGKMVTEYPLVVPTSLVTNSSFAFDRSTKGVLRVAVLGKLGNSSVYKFVEASPVPPVSITEAYLSNSSAGVQLPYVKTKKVNDSLFVNCGLFEYNRKIRFNYGNLLGVDQVFINGRWLPLADSNSRIFGTESNLFGTGIRFGNQCFTSSLVNIQVVGQNFTPGLTAAIPTAFCQGQNSVIDMTTTPAWIFTNGNFDLNYPSTFLDTIVVTDLALKQVAKFPQKTIKISEIPYSAGSSSRLFTISKKVTTKQGCSANTADSRFTIYKSPQATITLNRAIGSQKLLLPTDGKSISDTALYFAWGDKATTAQLVPTFDNSADMLGAYQLGNSAASVVSIGSGKAFVATIDTIAAIVTNFGKTIDLQVRNYNNFALESRACSTTASYKFLLKKVGFTDLGLSVIGDSVIKPGNPYSFGVYSTGLANKLSGLDYRFKWKVFFDSNLVKPVAKRFVELADTTTLTNINKIWGRTNGKYVLQVDIYLQQATGAQKFIGTLRKNVEVQSPAILVTESGGTIDPNRLGSNLCKVDTFSCSGLYLKSIAFSNLSQNRGGCANTPTVDNTSDSTKFIKVFTNENYQFSLQVGNEYSTTQGDSASIAVMIDYDNDGVMGEQGEVFVSVYSPVSEVSVLNSIPNLPSNIGDRRMSVFLTKDQIDSTSNFCALIAKEGNIQEDFLIHIESPPNLLVTSFVTPNGDGKNDNFEVRGVDERYSTKLTIYNKFGAYVYEKEGVGLSTYKTDGFEKNLRPDTYYYLFVNGDNTAKGFFEVR